LTGGGTALVAIATGRSESEKPQFDIYGNVFQNFNVGDGAIGFLGNGANGGNCTKCRVFNNTFIRAVSADGVQFPDGSDNMIVNNVWVNAGNPPSIAEGLQGTVSFNAFGPSGNGVGTNAQLSVPSASSRTTQQATFRWRLRPQRA
jgi:hypothetical protein